MNSFNFGLLSQVLQQAGLVSATQLETLQKEHSLSNNRTVGNILVRQGVISQKTLDFFTQKWSDLLSQQRQPLGKYFEEAGLLNSKQIQEILVEQKHSGKIFGEIAVYQGWLKQKTVDFFLQHLNQLQHKQRDRAENEQFDEAQVQTIGDRLVDNPRCQPLRLLVVYAQILEQGAVIANSSLEQAELLNLGLVIKQQEQLVANPAYRDMFNQRWLDKTFNYLQSRENEGETETVGSWERLTAHVYLWTNGQKHLTQVLCQLLGDYYSLIPAGEEARWVDEVVQTHIVENWEQGVASEHLCQMRDRLTHEDSNQLLNLYEQILKHAVPSDRTWEQQELLAMELVAIRHNHLFVYNGIYKQVFNLTWVEQAKAVRTWQAAPVMIGIRQNLALPDNRRKTSTLTKADSMALSKTVARFRRSISARLKNLATLRRPSKLSVGGGLMAFGGLASLLLVRSANLPNSQLSAQTHSTSLPAICVQYAQSRQEQIEQLRQLQQQGKLVNRCQQFKDELLYGHAIETLASNNYRQEAVNFLCEVTSSYYENKPNLIPYFRNWAESSNSFKTWLELYLKSNACPAANYLT